MKTGVERPMADANAPLDAFDRGARADRGAVAISGRPAPENGASGPKSAPADLLEFLAGGSVRDVADSLGLSRGTVHNLRNGYWPKDARKILTAWDDYKTRGAVRVKNWFLRRVYAGGVVVHARRMYTGRSLSWRVGQTVAMARMDTGGLIAQTLDVPHEHLILREVA